MQISPALKLAIVAGGAAVLVGLSIAAGFFWGRSSAPVAPATLSAKEAKAAYALVVKLDPDTAEALAPEEGQELKITHAQYRKWLEEQLDSSRDELTTVKAQQAAGAASAAVRREGELRLVVLGAELAQEAQIRKMPPEGQLAYSAKVVRAVTGTYTELHGETLTLPADLFAAQGAAQAAARTLP